MWLKKDNIGLWMWIPEKYIFRESVAFFTIKDNILNDNNQIQRTELDIILNVATIIIYENNTTGDLTNLFTQHIAEKISVIGIFSFKRNRYSKPFTGAIELLEQIASETNPWKFRPDLSIMVSHDIGINGHYIDRAFAHNIGIKAITTPNLYFKRSMAQVEWNWPTTMLTERQKKKLFRFTEEPKFADFLFAKYRNIVIITGPPNSGKTILGRRIAQYLGNCVVCKNELISPAQSRGKSLVHISRSPTIGDKETLLNWLLEYNKPFQLTNKKKTNDQIINPESDNNSANLVWIEMDVPRAVVEFLRYLRVQISRQTCPELTQHGEIKEYYKTVEILPEDKIPSAITHMSFPLILKKIPELDYIY